MENELTKMDILKRFSPGTALREGLDDILRGNDGALIVICNSDDFNLFEGGFRINCRYTSKRLAELAKMDGAIIISPDFKRILYANVLLVPDRSVPSIETGTRHQAAERTAKQTKSITVAVSERRHKITVYYGNFRFILQGTEELLRRATETLQILEKQRELFNESLSNLNLIEVSNLVSPRDIINIIQKIEMIKKMDESLNQYIIQLGREGSIVSMRVRELKKGIDKIYEFLLKDYTPKTQTEIDSFFSDLSFEGLLDTDSITKFLFGENPEPRILCKGYRILNKITLSESEIHSLIDKFGNLDGILNAGEEDLQGIVGNPATFQNELGELRQQILMGKRV